MNLDTLNARDSRATPGLGYREASRLSLQGAVSVIRDASGRTIYVLTGVYAVAEVINVVSTATMLLKPSRSNVFVQGSVPAGGHLSSLPRQVRLISEKIEQERDRPPFAETSAQGA